MVGKRFTLALLFSLAWAVASAQSPSGSGISESGLNTALANALYCQINGCSYGLGSFTLTAVTTPPTALTAALVAVAGNIEAGSHSYKVTYVTASGDTDGGTLSNAVVNDAGHGQNALSAVPLGPTGIVTQRKIYRNKVADQTHWFLQQTIADNTTTTGVQDNTADTGLGAAIPTLNTTLDNRMVLSNAGNLTVVGTINKYTLTPPASAATLTIADGKTLTASNSITLAGTDATTMTFPPNSAGIVGRVAVADLTTQGTAITSTLLYAVPANGAGVYKACWVATVTRAATTSSTLGGAAGFQLVYTDNDDSVVKTSAAAGAPSAGVNQAYSQTNQGNTTATQASGCVTVFAKASTNINYTYGYTSSGATTMQFNLHIRLYYGQ